MQDNPQTGQASPTLLTALEALADKAETKAFIFSQLAQHIAQPQPQAEQ